MNTLIRSDRHTRHRLALGTLCVLALGLGAWGILALPGPAYAAVDAVEEAPLANDLYTVLLSTGGFETALVLRDNATVTDAGGNVVGSWDQAVESDDFTVALGDDLLELVDIAQSLEGGSGVATFTTADGGDLTGTWTLATIHFVETGNLTYNLEFVGGVIYTGTFTTIEVDGEAHDVSVGTGNTVEIVSPLGNEVVELSDGCHVFIGLEEVSGNGLFVQDPQGKPGKRKDAKAGRKPVPSAPRTYGKEVWTKITEAKKHCFQGKQTDPAGRNCGAKGEKCEVKIDMVVGGVKAALVHSSPACENAAAGYFEGPNQSLFVNF